MDRVEINSERLHQSLPTLIVPNCPEVQIRPKARKQLSSRQKSDDALTYILSAFYAKILILLGIAFPITDAIATSDFDTFDGFYMYLYGGSIAFLIYMYFIEAKSKSVAENLKQTIGKRSSTWSNDSCNGNGSNQGSYIRYGSFYFRMGVTGFGVGSIIYSVLEFGQYWELVSGEHCENTYKFVKPMFRVIFGLTQLLFIFSYKNVLNEPKNKVVAKFGLMHMIATNLCEWLFVLVTETQHDIFKSAQKRQYAAARDNTSLSEVDSQFLNSTTFQITKNFYEHKFTCLKSNILEPLLEKLEPYLMPCTVEYSLLCACILMLMWKDCGGTNNEMKRKISEEKGVELQSGCNVIYSRSQSHFSVDCAQANKGLFAGILVLALTVISLIMFFELVTYKKFKDAAILQVNIWEAVLFWTATVACVLCITSLRDVSMRKLKRHLELEHLLLLTTQCGVFMYFLFQIIGGILMGANKGTGGLMRIITPFSALVQSSCQTVLVLDAWKRRCSSEEQMRKKPGRQFITFLLVTNVALWVVNRLKNNRSVSHPNQMDFYGVLAWNVITHVTMPLVVSYRFQSTVCFYEIWKHVYKMRSQAKEIKESDMSL